MINAVYLHVQVNDLNESEVSPVGKRIPLTKCPIPSENGDLPANLIRY